MNQDIYNDALVLFLKKQEKVLDSHFMDDGEKVWVRKLILDRWYTICTYKLLDFFAFIFGIEILASSYVKDKNPIIDESNQINKLKKHGILTPNILAINKNGLMLSDLEYQYNQPIQLAEELKLYYPNQINKLILTWKKAILEIYKIHKKNLYLSQAFARNILHDKDDNWIFLDFEDGVGRKYSIEDCQIRDYFLFLTSTAEFFDDYNDEITHFLINHINLYSESFRNKFLLIMKKISRLYIFHYILKYFGRDAKRFNFILLLARSINK